LLRGILRAARLADVMKLRWKMIIGLVVVAVALGMVFWTSPDADHGARKLLEETRRALRDQGFKTDLSEFDFFTSPELQTRETALTNAGSFHIPGGQAEARRRSLRQQLLPDLMQPVRRDAAIVMWQQPQLRFNPSAHHAMQAADLATDDGWAALRELFAADQPVLDTACMAALSGPIGFHLDARHGSAMLLPHLASLKNLAQTLGCRAVLELRDGNRNAAWTNALATTRLVTGWAPEPTEGSVLVWYACATIAFDTLWQMLAAGGWNEEQLRALQREWESVDFLAGLPETAAFARASAVAVCQQERQAPRPRWGLPFSVKQAMRFPREAWAALAQHRRQLRYRQYGSYEDERNLLIHYRDRELELKQALESQTWTEMRGLPGITNMTPFDSRHSSTAVDLLNTRQIALRMQMYHSPGQVHSLPGRAAEAEARRRLIVTAIALERYRERHGSYPETLSQLAPGLLKESPVDFMDGQPLRYRMTADGHFVLYSVGVDGIDHGGEMPQPRRQRMRSEVQRRFVIGQGTDLVWPRPASMLEAQAQAEAEARQAEAAIQAAREQAAAQQERMEELRRATVRKLVADAEAGRVPASGGGQEPRYRGQLLSQFLRNPDASGDAPARLYDMLTLRRVITGQEPELATFEVPVRYEALTNFGILKLMVDAEPVEDSESMGGDFQGCERAPNGNCRLVWNTTFDPPGQHVLHARLLGTGTRGRGMSEIRGPILPFYSSNVLQFDPFYSSFDSSGAILHARLAEAKGIYRIEIKSPTGALIRAFEGTTTNGEIMVRWDLKTDEGELYTGESFTCTFHVTLPESGRSATQQGY
jgi:hypothetical protein